ncbi:hypothetical protein EUA98_02800 [Pengzhenrongella frigida]|uniref:Uncharacterized protein n=2 Tax=Pengzhenrongella frigida TaxID=1259133 RepID=A0A4Q5N2M0_9MICO|nr:hypothetical protein EUA98_02800 [Cellulomonas sp. HLT2-17]
MTNLGHTSEGPTVSVSSARNGPTTDTPGSFAIELLADQGSSIERDHTGAIVDRIDESKSLSLVAALQHGENGWIVREVQVDEVPADG